MKSTKEKLKKPSPTSFVYILPAGFIIEKTKQNYSISFHDNHLIKQQQIKQKQDQNKQKNKKHSNNPRANQLDLN